MKHPNASLVARAMGHLVGDEITICNAWASVDIERVGRGGPFRMECTEFPTLDEALVAAYRFLAEYAAGRQD